MYFTIEGIPKALKRHRHTTKGFTYDPSKKDKKDLLLQVMKYAPKPPITAPIRIMLIFYMPRPKSHFRTGKYKHLLKDEYIRKYPSYHTFTPDLDNLVKLVSDALNGVFYKDDSQICSIQAIKAYSNDLEWNNDHPRTEVEIEEI